MKALLRDIPEITPPDMMPDWAKAPVTPAAGKRGVAFAQDPPATAATDTAAEQPSEKKRKTQRGGAFDSVKEAMRKKGLFYCVDGATVKQAFPDGLSQQYCFGHTCISKLCPKPKNACKFGHPNQFKDVAEVDRKPILTHLAGNDGKVWLNEERLGCTIPDEFKKVVGDANGPRG